MTHAETRCVGKRRPLEILSPAEVQRLHEASLKILAEVGCTYHSQAALDVLAEHGAQVDRETTVAKLPPELVQQALTTLPRSFVLGGRTPEYDLPLDGEHAYLTADGCAVLVREADGTVRA
jgi:trimethylamine--corrinoid protein Co-methyltransferase